MSNKKSILIVIDNLTRGGAETLLVGVLKELADDYHLVLVTLNGRNEFEQHEIICNEGYSLSYKGKLSFLRAVLKLREILNTVKPALIHAHLLNSSQIARMANLGLKFPMVYSLHSMLSQTAFNASWMYRSLEKLLFSKNDHIVAVSTEVLKDYERCIARSAKAVVISNYVADEFISSNKADRLNRNPDHLKMVAVGNFKKVKNYEYVLEAFLSIDRERVSLDIYGGGEEIYRQSLQHFINQHSLPITLKPQSKNVAELLAHYDVLLLCSKNEGFGMAAVEGMAAGLPLIVSDLPVLRAVTLGNALFVNLDKPADLAKIVQEILNKEHDLKKMKKWGVEIVRANYTKAIHLQKLQNLYAQIISKNTYDQPSSFTNKL